MRRAVVLAVLGSFALVSCRRLPKRTDKGGVVIEERSDGQYMRGGAIPSFAVSGQSGAASIAIAPWVGREPIVIEAMIDGHRKNLVGREVVTLDGAAAIKHTLDGTEAELFLTIDPTVPAIVLRARAPKLPPGSSLAIHLSMKRGTSQLILEKGAAFEPLEKLLPTRSHLAVIGETDPVVIAAPREMDVTDGLSTITTAEPRASGEVEVRAVIATAKTTHEALLLGARLAGVPARTGTDLRVEVRDAKTKAPLPARVWFDGPPAKIVFDPAREAEPGLPIVDVTDARTVVPLPPGKWALRATHGLGWSVARRDVETVAGDVGHVVIELAEEAPAPDWIGCDFHVHARGSFDAKAVSYEDRVRSLAAVGVDCAAATEHDHVGDHGPAAEKLHLDDRFRALSGVELTTLAPTFGHFNVYPWPAGATIPQTKATTVAALFDAVERLRKAGSFVFQVNHPRMRNGDQTSIGFFDLIGRDPMTGAAKGTYRRDYDAIEVFNGYDLGHLDDVRAIVDEWIRMLDAGDPHVATGSSDSHGIGFPWAGFPRTLVKVGAGWRKDRPVQGIVDALKAGRAYVSSGPILEFGVDAATIGDTVAGGQSAHVAVGKSSWLGTPKITLVLGTERLPAVDGWTTTTALPKVTRKRPLVAIVEAPLIGEAPGLTGFDRAFAVTNPIWLTP